MVNGLKVIETFGSDQFTRFGTINAKFFIKKTNETDENTYHLVDTIGEIYNLPAEPNEFILEDIHGNTYLSTNGCRSMKLSGLLADRARSASKSSRKESPIFLMSGLQMISSSLSGYPILFSLKR